MRGIACALAILVALLQSGAAFAHASLVRAEPADGAVLADAPAVLRLTFNEPVSLLVVRLIAPDGSVAVPKADAENATVTIRPEPLQHGTHVLSWRVVSADGHPVGGSLVFSVGEATERPSPGALLTGNPLVRTMLWMTKLVIYAALLAGIGGAFFRAWMFERARGTPWLHRALMSVVVAGLLAAPLSVGLQGLDALDAALPALANSATWTAGFATTYGYTAIAFLSALLAGLFSLAPSRAARGLALAAMAFSGLALALSGHASNAPPQWLTRPSVFVHVVCVAFWIGALLPLIASIRRGERSPPARLTRAIPYLLVGVVASGALLALRQLDRIDALWTTNYGIVLSCKVAVVIVLLGLGALNRYVLVPRYWSRGAIAAAPLARSIAVEIGLAAAIVALVALWRFTPPPRALAAAEPIELHLHGQRAMAQLTLTPARARAPRVNVQVLDGELRPLAVKEVTLSLANLALKMEPIRRAAVRSGDSVWQVEGLRVPQAGRWVVRVDLLIDDFERVELEEEVDLPRLP